MSNKGLWLLVGLLSGALSWSWNHQKAIAAAKPLADGFPCFSDVTSKAGLDFQHVGGSREKKVLVEQMSGGAAFVDYDQDGLLDIYLVSGTTIERYRGESKDPEPPPSSHLYRNKGDGSFENVTERARVGKAGWGMGVCAADYDNDGYPDLYLTNYGPNVLYRNNGNGTFSEVTELAQVGDGRWGTGCSFGDYDRDGYLDLFVANYAEVNLDQPPYPCHYYEGIQAPCSPKGLPGQSDILYRNLGNGRFEDVSGRAQIKDNFYGFGVTFADFNNDSWLDIYVANDITPSLLYLNRQDGTFKETGSLAGVAFSIDGVAQAGMGIDAADYDNDGLLDLFRTNFSGDYNTLYHNDGKGFFSDVTVRTGLGQVFLAYVGWGTGFFDFNNDGLKDLFVANGHVVPNVERASPSLTYAERSQFLKNIKGRSFQEVTSAWCGSPLVKVSRGAAFGDYDNDGDVDVLVNNLDDRPALLRNDGGNQNRFLQVRALSGKPGKDAIGARVTIKASGLLQVREILSGSSYMSQSDFRAHFGMGQETTADLQVRWPSGKEELWRNVKTNTLMVVREGEGTALSKVE